MVDDMSRGFGSVDTAESLWGPGWQMLTDETTIDTSMVVITWCDGSTVKYAENCTLAGVKISGLADTIYAENSIFLPAAGTYVNNPGVEGVLRCGTNGYCWTSVMSSGTLACAYSYSGTYPYLSTVGVESLGCSVRAIYVGE